ncbi:hypothetical protein D3C85_1888940 [compost metagenome]
MDAIKKCFKRLKQIRRSGDQVRVGLFIDPVDHLLLIFIEVDCESALTRNR